MSLRNLHRFLIARPRKKTVNPLLAAIQEAATEIHAEGLIDRRRMHKYDTPWLSSVPVYSSESIRALRHRYYLSQAIFATVLSTSLSTVRQWEIGDKQPGGPSLKFLNLLDRKGLEVFL